MSERSVFSSPRWLCITLALCIFAPKPLASAATSTSPLSPPARGFILSKSNLSGVETPTTSSSTTPARTFYLFAGSAYVAYFTLTFQLRRLPDVSH